MNSLHREFGRQHSSGAKLLAPVPPHPQIPVYS